MNQVHAYLIGALHSQMPAFFGQDSKKTELIHSLASIFEELKNKFNISPGDLPDLEKTKVYRSNLK